MIIGIGIDIVNNERIEKIIKKYEKKFIKKYFHEEEYEYYNEKKLAQKIAKLYGSKEAFFKAIGTGLRKPMSFKDIKILKDKKGKPYIKIEGKTKEYIENHIGKEEELNIQISTSDEKEFSISTVMIEKIDKK